jgi:transposase
MTLWPRFPPGRGSSHSLYKWVQAVSPNHSEKQAAELIEAKSETLRLEAQLRRTEEERDILKNRLPGTPWPMELETRPLH